MGFRRMHLIYNKAVPSHKLGATSSSTGDIKNWFKRPVYDKSPPLDLSQRPRSDTSPPMSLKYMRNSSWSDQDSCLLTEGSNNVIPYKSMERGGAGVSMS